MTRQYKKISSLLRTIGMLPLMLAIIMCSGCALHPVVPYDAGEKVLFGTAVGGQVYDYTSTRAALDAGCIETNPIMGEHPTDGAMIGMKVLMIGTMYLTANAISNHMARKTFLGVISVIGIAAGVHNSQVDCQ